MRIAVASQNFRTITGHAGKTRRFLVFEAVPGHPAQEVDRIDMPKEMSIHAFRGDGPHPLDIVQAVIAGSAGEGFTRRMAMKGILAVTTSETDPATAAAALAEGRLQLTPIHRHHGHHHHDDQDEGDEGCSSGL